MTEISDFILNYSLGKQSEIVFACAGQDSDTFIDLNLEFRRKVNKAVIHTPKNVPLDLVRDLYNAEILYAQEACCISSDVRHLGTILLTHGGSSYLKDFLQGRYHSMDTRHETARVQVSKELAIILKKECQKLLDSEIDTQERKLWEDGVNFFENQQDYTYPAWFYRNLVEDSFSWDLGKIMSFAAFESKYTLHDSGWGSTSISCSFDSLILVIDWDTVWLTEPLKAKIEEECGRVFLLIKLMGVKDVSILKQHPRSDFISVIVSHDLVGIDNNKVLSIADAAGGEMDIIYTGEEIFLAITEQETILEL
jgi:hypothetical protein